MFGRHAIAARRRIEIRCVVPCLAGREGRYLPAAANESGEGFIGDCGNRWIAWITGAKCGVVHYHAAPQAPVRLGMLRYSAASTRFLRRGPARPSTGARNCPV